MQKKIYQYKRTWLILLVVTYLLIGFFYLPKVIEKQINTQLNEHLAMQAEMSEVKFNPFSFTTRIKDLKLTDSNDENWYQSAETSINFDPLNLIFGQWKFSDLNLDQPKITLLTDTEGKVIIPALPEFAESESSDEVIDFSISNITLNNGVMNLQADSIKQGFSMNLKHIEISHDQFNLADIDTNFDIKITTENDEILALDGSYNHPQQTVNTAINLNDWQATTLNKVLPDDLSINNFGGIIEAAGSIKWQLEQKPLLSFSSIEITDLESQWQDSVVLNSFQSTLLDVEVDTETQKILIDSIESNSANWQLNWPISSPETSNANYGAANEEDSWQINIKTIQTNDWPVELIDNDINAILPLTLKQLEISDVNNNNQTFNVTSELNINDESTININSEQQIEPLNIEADIVLDNISMAKVTPWITAQSGLVFTQGQLSSKQNIQINQDNFNLTGDLSINSANIVNQSDQAIADWNKLKVAATSISSQNKTIVIDQITLDQANGNIIIDKDKNINIQNLNNNAAEQIESSEGAKNDWVIKVGLIDIKDTSTALIDESIQPTVKTNISELNGAIKGLSSESLSKADVDITGKFNQFSPLSIQGKINPLSSEAYTDLKVVVQDLDLLAFSPYSTKAVAFPINGGKLDLELEYSLNKDELKGKNNLLFKQFKLGNKTPSPDAVDLPLKLAVNLLTGMNGEMKINLPVSGNINDPEFSYGSLVGKAFFKLITSIVASPFKILGALIPNPDPNLSDIQFASGSADLLESEKNKLNQIAEIMAKKSSLNLQLNPKVDAEFDQKGLQLNLLLAKAPFEQFDANNPDVTDWLNVQLSPEELATHQSEDGIINYDNIWSRLLERQTVTDIEFKELTTQRNNNIKQYLLETAGIAADKVFVEQAVNQADNQSMVEIGVSQ